MSSSDDPDQQLPLNAILGHGAHYQGDLSFEGRVRIDGHFTGRVYTEDILELGPQGLIEGEADVARAVISGHVRGKLRCREHLVVESTGFVDGALDAGVLDLRPGGRIRGEVFVAGEELP